MGGMHGMWQVGVSALHLRHIVPGVPDTGATMIHPLHFVVLA